MSNNLSSDAILDSLYDDLAKGIVSFDAIEELANTSTAVEDVSFQPSTSTKRDDETVKPVASAPNSPNVIDENRDDKPEFTVAEAKTSGAKRSAIKIASLKESTKSRIVIQNEQSGKRKEKGKIGEEGEILPSDAGSDESASEENDHEQTINESDGELASSGDEKIPSKKSKKKKHKHRHHHRKHRKHSPSRNKEEKNPKLLKYLEKPPQNDDTRHGHEMNPKEMKPWKNMLNFHLNSGRRVGDLSRDRRSRPCSADRRDFRASSSFSRRNLSRTSVDRATPINYRARRYSRSPDYRRPTERGEKPFWRPAPPDSRLSSTPWRMNERRGVHERRTSRDRSPIRSGRRSVERMPPPSGHRDGDTNRADSKSESQTPAEDEIIDKKKLYEIARRNAAAMFKSGELQKHISSLSTEDLMKLRTGGKSVEDLIAYCRKIQEKEKAREEGASSSDEGEGKKEDEDELDTFIRHPFLLKQASNFVFNVKNVIQIPVKTPAERAADDAKLRITFPVSSGEQHKTTDLEWVPVSPPSADSAKATTSKAAKSSVKNTTVVPALPPPPSPPALDFIPPPPEPPALLQMSALPQPPKPPIEQPPVDIGEVVNSRLKAIQRLNDNANDVEAMKLLHFADQQMQTWAETKNIPGLFLGNTSAECVTPHEFAPSETYLNAWAKKDYLTTTKPVSGGVGMTLMQKMGWRPGEGLGKNRAGTLEPLLLEIKQDRKGLVASQEGPNQRVRSTAMNLRDFQGKHPVSALMELCSKRRWGPPSFSCVEAGPSHDRRFSWKVLVNGIEYQTATPANNKKTGKAQVCQVVLQSLGLIPRDRSLPITIG